MTSDRPPKADRMHLLTVNRQPSTVNRKMRVSQKVHELAIRPQKINELQMVPASVDPFLRNRQRSILPLHNRTMVIN